MTARPGPGASAAPCPDAPPASLCVASAAAAGAATPPGTRDRPGEPDPVVAGLALRHRDLMAQGEDFRVLVPIAHRDKAQHGERVRHGQVSRSQQHDRPSCRGGRQPLERTHSSARARDRAPRAPAPTRADEVSAGAGLPLLNPVQNFGGHRAVRLLDRRRNRLARGGCGPILYSNIGWPACFWLARSALEFDELREPGQHSNRQPGPGMRSQRFGRGRLCRRRRASVG